MSIYQRTIDRDYPKKRQIVKKARIGNYGIERKTGTKQGEDLPQGLKIGASAQNMHSAKCRSIAFVVGLG